MAAAVHWLLKAEPEPHVVGGRDMGSQPYSLLETAGSVTYEGVRNFTARNNIRDKIKPGQHVFWYHASCAVPGIAGIAEVVAKGPDPCAADPSHPFYDARHTPEEPRWFNLRLRPVRALARHISLTELRAHGDAGGPLAGMTLLKQSRLSVGPVTDAEWAAVLALEVAPAPAGAQAAGGKPKAGSKGGKAAGADAASSSSSPSASAAAGAPRSAKASVGAKRSRASAATEGAQPPKRAKKPTASA